MKQILLALSIVAILASEGGSAAQLKPALTLEKNSDSSGRFEIRDGKEDGSWLATRFRESLWQSDNGLRQLNQQSPRSLDAYLASQEFNTAIKLLALAGIMKTGDATHTWVFDEPARLGGEVVQALELEDLSGPDGYHVRATMHCYDAPEFCNAYRNRLMPLLAPKPAAASGDLAQRQWQNHVRTEACTVFARNMQQPRYPETALREGIEGSVLVGILFNSCGNVRDAWVQQSSGHRELDRAAMSQALKWQIDISALPNPVLQPGRANVPIKFMVGE